MSDSVSKVAVNRPTVQPRPTPYFGASPTVPATGGMVNHRGLIPQHRTGVVSK